MFAFGLGGVPVLIWSRYLPHDALITVRPFPNRSYVPLNRGAQLYQSGLLRTSGNDFRTV